MLKQLSHSIPVSGVFFQANQNKLFGLVTYGRRLWKPNLVLNYLNEIPLSVDIERHPSKQQLISQDTHTPDVDLVVVVFPF